MSVQIKILVSLSRKLSKRLIFLSLSVARLKVHPSGPVLGPISNKNRFLKQIVIFRKERTQETLLELLLHQGLTAFLTFTFSYRCRISIKTDQTQRCPVLLHPAYNNHSQTKSHEHNLKTDKPSKPQI